MLLFLLESFRIVFVGPACDRLPCDDESCVQFGSQLTTLYAETTHEFDITPSSLDLSVVLTLDAHLNRLLVYRLLDDNNFQSDHAYNLEAGIHNFVYQLSPQVTKLKFHVGQFNSNPQPVKYTILVCVQRATKTRAMALFI